MTRARRCAAVTAIGAALLASGCAPLAPTLPLEPDAPVLYPRTLQADRTVEVRVRSMGGEDVVVTGGALDSGLFEPAPPTERDVRVYPGYQARARLPLGEPTCPPVGDDAAAELTVEVDGVEGRQRVAVDGAALVEINREECAMRAAVTLTSVAGSVIFAMDAAAGSLPATLGPGDDARQVPVSIRVARCDPHAFAESKKTFLFKVWMTMDGGPEAYIEVYAGGELREALQDLFDACGESARSSG